MTRVHWQMMLLGLAALTFLGLSAMPWRFYEDPGVVDAVSQLDGQWVDRPAPPFELTDLEGRSHRLQDYQGQVIFLNFWASFCEPCRREMPSMERLVRQYTGQGMVMLAVSLDTEAADASAFMEQFLPGQRSAMRVLLDPTGDVAAAFGTEKIPETYIIDRDGQIVARFVGEYDWTRGEVKQIIEALM